MYTYRINVARHILGNAGKPFGPYHRHHFEVIKTGCPEDTARGLLQEITHLFPDCIVSMTRRSDVWETVL